MEFFRCQWCAVCLFDGDLLTFLLLHVVSFEDGKDTQRVPHFTYVFSSFPVLSERGTGTPWLTMGTTRSGSFWWVFQQADDDINRLKSRFPGLHGAEIERNFIFTRLLLLIRHLRLEEFLALSSFLWQTSSYWNYMDALIWGHIRPLKVCVWAKQGL